MTYLWKRSSRWIVCHSALKASDAVVFGDSKVAQSEGISNMISMRPFPEELVKKLDTL